MKELHRLYGVQRILMNELKSKVTIPDQTKQGCFGLQQCAKEPSTGRQELEEIELTLGIGNKKYSDKGMKKKYQEKPHCNVDLFLFSKFSQ